MTWNRTATPTTDTAPQRALTALLTRMGFDVECEVRVGPYALDCFVRELHLGFEADGPTHSARRDAKRDSRVLSEYDIPIMRLSDSALRGDRYRAIVTTAIENFIDNWADSVDARREATRGIL